VTTFAKRKDRINHAADEIDAAIRAVSVGKTADEIGTLRTTLYGKPSDVPAIGDRFTCSDLFAGTPFYGVSGKVTSDPAMSAAGVVTWAKHRVMVRFDRTIVGPRRFYPMPVLGLAVVKADAPVAPDTDAGN
jgi:hypothetical protein